MNVNTLHDLAPGTEADHIVWGDANPFHRKSFHNRYFMALEKVVLPVAQRKGSVRVLDAPCGDGRGTAYIQEQLNRMGFSSEVAGIDINEDTVQYAISSFPDTVYFQGSLTEPAFQGIYDAVICMEVLEHVTAEEARQIVTNVESMLAPGGKAIFTSPRMRPREFTKSRDHHIHEFYDPEFYYLIEEFFPLVERYTFDRYANAVHYAPNSGNLMVGIATKWHESDILT